MPDTAFQKQLYLYKIRKVGGCTLRVTLYGASDDAKLIQLSAKGWSKSDKENLFDKTSNLLNIFISGGITDQYTLYAKNFTYIISLNSKQPGNRPSYPHL